MQCIRDYEQHKIYLQEGEQKLMEFGFCADEFVMIFYTKQRIMVPKEIDEDFYQAYSQLFAQKYQFSNSFCSQSKNRIVWFSDGTCNLDDLFETRIKSRACIEKEKDSIVFSAMNPFYDQHPHSRDVRTVIFSPAGNGHSSYNKKTGSSFQDDIVMIHQRLLQKNKQKIK